MRTLKRDLKEAVERIGLDLTIQKMMQWIKDQEQERNGSMATASLLGEGVVSCFIGGPMAPVLMASLNIHARRACGRWALVHGKLWWMWNKANKNICQIV